MLFILVVFYVLGLLLLMGFVLISISTLDFMCMLLLAMVEFFVCLVCILSLCISLVPVVVVVVILLRVDTLLWTVIASIVLH